VKKKAGYILLGIFLLIGFFLRSYRLAEVPQGFNWDEAANGYNAYSLLKTGKDEFGKPWPLFLESFGEYKSGLGIIALVPIIKILGLSIFSVRLLTVIFGCLLILASFYLALKVFKKTIPASLVAGLIAISPWAIHTSRFSLEWYLGFPLMVLGLTLLIDSKKQSWKMPAAAVILAVSLYFYSNTKLFLPLILLAYGLIYWKSLKQRLKLIVIASILGLLVLLPLFRAMQQTDWLTRARKISLITHEGLLNELNEGLYRHNVTDLPLLRLFNNKPLFFGKEFIDKYLQHFSPEFLFLGKDATPRLEISKVGKLYLISFPFLIWGLVGAIKRRNKLDKFLLTWLALAPIASSLTIDSPHGLRAVIMMPVLQIFTVQGLMSGYKFVAQKRLLLKAGSIMIVIGLYLGGLSYFLWRYFLFYPEYTAPFWLDGHKEVVEKINSLKHEYDRVIFTTFRGQPHIFLAFFSPIEPELYQNEVTGQQNIFNAYLTHLDGVEFKRIEAEDFCLENTLIIDVDEPEKMPLVSRLDTIYYQNRFHEPEIAFELFDTKDQTVNKYLCPKKSL